MSVGEIFLVFENVMIQIKHLINSIWCIHSYFFFFIIDNEQNTDGTGLLRYYAAVDKYILFAAWDNPHKLSSQSEFNTWNEYYAGN